MAPAEPALEERADLRRGWRRFAGRFEGMGGKSCHVRLENKYATATLRIRRRDPSHVTELELDWPGLLRKNKVEIEDFSTWTLEQKLAAYATHTRVRRRGNPDGVTTEYVLPVAGHATMGLDLQPRRANQSNCLAVYSVRDRGALDFDAELVGRYEVDPPSELAERIENITELPVQLAAGPQIYCGAGAHCGSLSSFGSFRPSRAALASAWLEVDLGVARVVQAVTTRARRIATTLFPDNKWLSDRGLYMARRPSVMTIREPNLTPDTETFFPKYELQYLRDADGMWVSCGVLQGPRNNFEERVAWLADVPNKNAADGIFCQRMRVRVVVHKNDASLDFRGLSIAAFGPPRAAEAANAKPETTFVLPKSRKARAVEIKRGSRSAGCPCCKPPKPLAKSAARALLRRSALRDVASHRATSLC